MKRIVNGVTYNTQTSALIARWQQAAGDRDPTSKTIDLYKTRGGAFFLHTREAWHVRNDETNEWEQKYREGCDPMMRDEAQKWVMKDNTEIYDDREFGLPPEAAAEEVPSATIFARVPQSLKARVDAAAGAANLSINAWALRCMASQAATSLAMAHQVASSIESFPKDYTPNQLRAAIDDMKTAIQMAWDALKLPRAKGTSFHEDITLYGITRFGSDFEKKWQPHRG
jgi:predicted HicB family RNase H-like nuclease